MNIVMLVIDMQRCFVDQFPDRRPALEACEVINYVADMLRKAGHPIIHVKDVESRGEFTEEELAFLPEIHIDKNDLQMEKVFSNAFWKTDLEERLRERAIDLLVVSGQAAEHCVLFTYNGASERGFQAAILQDAVASGKPDRVTALYEDRNLISHGVIQAICETSSVSPV